jgi:hypothetical protein
LGSIILERKEKVTRTRADGSENECKMSYADYYEIQLGDGKTVKVPRTVNYSARIRSPSGYGKSGTIQCVFEFSYINR